MSWSASRFLNYDLLRRISLLSFCLFLLSILLFFRFNVLILSSLLLKSLSFDLSFGLFFHLFLLFDVSEVIVNNFLFCLSVFSLFFFYFSFLFCQIGNVFFFVLFFLSFEPLLFFFFPPFCFLNLLFQLFLNF